MSDDNVFGFSRVGFATKQADGTYKPVELDLSAVTVKTFKMPDVDSDAVVYRAWENFPSITFVAYFESHKIYSSKLTKRRLQLPTIDARCLRRK